jgi:phosphoglycolate phosphatase-like HAD superfamily hydrolase
MKNLLVFDNDGVLRDESVSYQRCVRETVEFFGNGIPASEEELIESLKKSNDDWDRTHKILEKRGVNISFSDVKEHFQDLYLGKKRDFTGYINNEPWLADNLLLEKLSKENILAIVSGAPKEEIVYTLKKNNAFKYFSLILGMDDCKNKKDGVELAINKFNPKKVFFCDDRPSPIKEVKKVNFDVDVYGILPPLNIENWGNVLADAGATKVFKNVNEYLNFLLSQSSRKI